MPYIRAEAVAGDSVAADAQKDDFLPVWLMSGDTLEEALRDFSGSAFLLPLT